MNGRKYPNGTVYQEALAETPLSTARLYDSIYVRHWDRWLTPETYTLFAGTLTPSSTSSDSSPAWTFSGELSDLLDGIEGQAETPVQPFGDSGDYDITPDGSTVAFLTKAPELPYANYTASYLYLVSHELFHCRPIQLSQVLCHSTQCSRCFGCSKVLPGRLEPGVRSDG